MGKIFCIGMNKTGTMSLHVALGRLGFNSLHWAPDEIKTIKEKANVARKIKTDIYQSLMKGALLLEKWPQYDAYLDIVPIRIYFKLLDKQYPKSKFIYSDRNEDEWIESRKKHVERNIIARETGKWESDFVNIDATRWRKERRSHYKNITSFFKDRKNDLLVMNISDGDGYEELAPFLGITSPSCAFPSFNRAPTNTATPPPNELLFIEKDKQNCLGGYFLSSFLNKK